MTGQRVTLSWQPPADGAWVTGYELEVGSGPGGADVLRSPVGAPPLDVPGVGNGTYYTRLRSVGPTGRSAPTPDLVVSVGRCTLPGAITLSGQGSASGVHPRLDAGHGIGAVHLRASAPARRRGPSTSASSRWVR